MGKNLIIKEFTADGTWTAPAGVTQVEVVGEQVKFPADTSGKALTEYLTYSWGFGQTLGDNTIVNKSSPVVIANAFIRFVQLSRSSNHVLALTAEGDCWSWGSNSSGQLGINTIVDKSSPTLVVGGLKFKQVCAGGSHSYGLDFTGLIWAWGSNTFGQLGDGTVVSKSSPVLIGNAWFKSLPNHVGNTSFALTPDGRAFGWGINTNGQIGDGTVVNKSTPVVVLGTLKFKQISSASSHTLAITEDGTAYSWGDNINYGQLGDGTVVPKSSPVLVSGGLKFIQICTSQSAESSIGITNSNDAYTWGRNTSGQLGDGTIVPKSSPVAVVGGLKFFYVSGNNETFHAIKQDGIMYGWGFNSLGNIGDSTTVSKSSPVLVSGGINFLPYYNQGPVFRKNFTVVPGTTYQVSFSSYYSKFNYENIGTYPGCKSITLRYYA